MHEVEDDITSCRTELMTKCRDVTVGYVTKPECDEVSLKIQSLCWSTKLPPVACGKMHPGEKACEEVHPRDRLLQGAKGALCAPWVRIQKRKRTLYALNHNIYTTFDTQGTVECHDKVKTIVVDNPLETCEIEPQRTCKHVTKLVPRLVAAEECVDVPKEVCSRSKSNPRKIKKPVIKKWCYVPSKESGLE